MSQVAQDRPRSSRARGPLDFAAIALAVIGQAVVLVPFTVASGLVAPMWAVMIFYVMGAASVVLLWRTARSRPLAAPLVPIANAALLAAAVTAGETWLGWTA